MRERLVSILRKTQEGFPANPSIFDHEIEECINYFDKQNAQGKHKVQIVHGTRAEVQKIGGKRHKYILRRLVLPPLSNPGLEEYKEENGHLVRTRRDFLTDKVKSREIVTKKDLDELVGLVHNITITYAQHIDRKKQ